MNHVNIKKKILIVLIAFCCINLVACNHEKPKYLSITTTGYNENGDLEFNIYKYPLSHKKVENKLKKIYSSQYPLGVYSQYNNKVYYTVESNGDQGDQLFVYDLNTHKSEMLTHDIYTINQIIPVNNKVYILGAMFGEKILKPSIYNLDTKELKTLNKNDDLNFDNMIYDVFNHNMYFLAYYQKEDDKALEEANRGGKGKNILLLTRTFLY